MKKYTIGQISKIVGLPAKTIRFYEESGVITTPSRLENSYRYFSADSIEELKLLKYVRDLGLPLSEVKKLMKGCDGHSCEHSRGYIDSSIDNYLTLLDTKIKQMLILQSKLQELKQSLHTTNSSCQNDKYCCNILHQLIVNQTKGGD